MTDIFPAKLVVTPDKSTPGSEGRLYLQLPSDLEELVGRRYKTIGRFVQDRAITLVENADGNVITPKRQYWWKNGVRDHGLVENWTVHVYICTVSIITIALLTPTGEPKPVLPPRQIKLFDVETVSPKRLNGSE